MIMISSIFIFIQQLFAKANVGLDWDACFDIIESRFSRLGQNSRLDFWVTVNENWTN